MNSGKKTLLTVFAVCGAWVSQPVRAEGQAFGFSRTCKVYAEPRTSSTAVCTGSPNDSVREMEKAENGFYRVELKTNCVGYVTDSCLNLPTFRKIKKEEVRPEQPIYQRFQFGPLLAASVLFADDGTSDTLNKGWGYEMGVRADIPVLRRFRLSPFVKYVGWMITRNLSSSSAISSPTDQVRQTLKYLSLGASIGYTFGARYSMETGLETAGNRTFWTELGLEFLNPLSASQQLNGGPATEFENSDKPLLVSLAAGVDWPITSHWVLGTHASFFYNVAADNGSKLFGFRGQLNLTFGLQ